MTCLLFSSWVDYMYYINKSVSPHVYCLDSRINGYTYTDILVGVHGNECCNQRKIKTIGCNSGFDVSLMDLILQLYIKES